MSYLVPRLPGLARAVIACLWLLLGSASAIAQDPSVVRLIVPSPAGGGLDLTARTLALRLSTLTGESYVVENRPGANTAIGSQYVARAPADGHTILFTGNSLVVIPWLQQLGFSPLNDLRPVVQIALSHYVLVVATASGIESVQELQERARRGGLNCAAPPGPMGVACEQLRVRSPGQFTTVPYPGIVPAVAALMGGHVDFAFVNIEAVDPLLRSGRLRALATSSPAAASGVPLITQVWPRFLLEGFAGLFVPAATPTETVRRINRQVNQVLAEPAFRKFLEETRQDLAGGTPEEFASQVASAYQRYGELIRKLQLSTR